MSITHDKTFCFSFNFLSQCEQNRPKLPVLNGTPPARDSDRPWHSPYLM